MEPKVVIQPVIIKNDKFTTTAEQEMDSVINLNNEYRIPITRSVLYERCSFFTSMKNFKETNAEEIDIHYDADVTVFQALVDYIHTGKIELTTSNLGTVISGAIYFQLDDLLKCCCNVLKQNTDLQTVGHIYNFAKELGLNQIRKAAVDFKAEHFRKIASSEVFCEWVVDCMLELLSSDEVVVSHEKKIVKFVFDWMNVDPKERDEHATDLFRKLRFSYLNEKDMQEVVEENSNEKLGQILQQVASEFSNKITPPRIYLEGIYVSGYNRDENERCFVRYCPIDGSIKHLKPPYGRIVANNDDIYVVKLCEESGIHIEKYDAYTDTWPSIASKRVEMKIMRHKNREILIDDLNVPAVSVCQEKIFVFIQCFDERKKERNFCMMYRIKTDTWARVPKLEGKPIRSSTTCGDCIYMTRHTSTNLLQYKPSTGVVIDITCRCRLGPRGRGDHATIAYKSNILLLRHEKKVVRNRTNRGMSALDHRTHDLNIAADVVFNTDTKKFTNYDLTATYTPIGGLDELLSFAVFNDSVYVFAPRSRKVYRFDLSFIDEEKYWLRPTLISLPHRIANINIWRIVSIQ